MGAIYEGGFKTKPKMKLEGNKVIVERIACYDGSIPITYTKEVIYYFESEDKAKEYYYKNR